MGRPGDTTSPPGPAKGPEDVDEGIHNFFTGQFAIIAIVLGILLGLVVIFALSFVVYRRKYKSLKRRVPSIWYNGGRNAQNMMVTTAALTVCFAMVKPRAGPTPPTR
ncbi:hypothetical protein BSL78_15155 [Apostichopus japonicus]|uniref:Uncharacterized protein n=1 Tax=Stichopus japonicus TaxID=307972 RepID=A0A2G8KIZ7_STIJA|nr:hypothetical protein BSL78_15155 [Apostichopus japonicus]